MTGLNVPLTVRIGDRHVTKQVSDISFRREAVGGVRNLTLNLSRDVGLLEADMAPFTKVYIYDARTAEPVAQGRLADSGRSAGAGGQSWDIVAFGPVQQASDYEDPLIYLDRSLSEGWRHADVSLASAVPSVTTKPGDLTSAAPQGVLLAVPDGTPLATSSRLVYRYERLYQAGQNLAYVSFNWDAGLIEPLWKLQVTTRVDGGATGEDAISIAADIGGGANFVRVVTHFPFGRNTADLRWIWTGGVTGTSGDTNWGWFDTVTIEAIRLDITGASITTGYTGATNATQIVTDLIARRLPEFDKANATIAAASTAPIYQLAYPDGVTTAQVLEDLMQLEPAYRWYTTPDNTGGGYGFRWETWPTTVRYEITLNDGGTFPLSGQELYNRVAVKWTDAQGMPRWTHRIMACELLDKAGLVRKKTIDLGSEVGSDAAANTAGDTFLAQHNVPANSGSIRVSRPIRDLIAGRLVDPWQIEAGELIRVRGVESYADSLNASDSDGQSVFRIWSMDYSSADNSANLALDADPADLTSALVKLLGERKRK